MKLYSHETELIGRWDDIGGTIQADAVATRIKMLTNTYLTKVASGQGGWEALYRDPVDLRYWELTYPSSEMHGGGPPMLRSLSEEQARAKYKF